MITINRNKLIAEELIRTHIRKRVSEKLKAKNLAEAKIRKTVRMLIIETATGTAESAKSTGINVLASLLEKIVPILEDDFKMLTTSDQQRESFRNHMVMIFDVKMSTLYVLVTPKYHLCVFSLNVFQTTDMPFLKKVSVLHLWLIVC